MSYSILDLIHDLAAWRDRRGDPDAMGSRAMIAADSLEHGLEAADGFEIDGVHPDGTIESAELIAFIGGVGRAHDDLVNVLAELAEAETLARPVVRADRTFEGGNVVQMVRALIAEVVDARIERDEARELARRRRDERNLAVRRLRWAREEIAGTYRAARHSTEVLESLSERLSQTARRVTDLDR